VKSNVDPINNITFDKIIYTIADKVEAYNINKANLLFEDSISFDIYNDSKKNQLKCDIYYKDFNIYCSSDEKIYYLLKKIDINKKIDNYEDFSLYVKNSIIESLLSRKIYKFSFETFNTKLDSDIYKIDALRNSYSSLDSYFLSKNNVNKYVENNFVFYEFNDIYDKFKCSVIAKMPEPVNQDVIYAKDFIDLSIQEKRIKNLNVTLDKYNKFIKMLNSYSQNLNKFNSKFDPIYEVDIAEMVSKLDFISIEDFIEIEIGFLKSNKDLHNSYKDITKAEDVYNNLLKKLKEESQGSELIKYYNDLIKIHSNLSNIFSDFGNNFSKEAVNVSEKLDNYINIYDKSVIDNFVLTQLSLKYWLDLDIESSCFAS